MRAVCVLVVAVALLPARWTWAGETTARDVSEPTTRVVTVGELTRALQGAGGPAGAGGDDLRRGLLDVLQDAPHLHVLPQRRSLDPQQPLRLEVEDTGQAVSVTRAHLTQLMGLMSEGSARYAWYLHLSDPLGMRGTPILTLLIH